MSFIGVGIGAGVGLASSLIVPAAQGKPITWQGALMGLGAGGAGGAAGAALGGLGGAAAGSATGATSGAATGATTGAAGGATTGATTGAATGATTGAATGATTGAATGASSGAVPGAVLPTTALDAALTGSSTTVAPAMSAAAPSATTSGVSGLLGAPAAAPSGMFGSGVTTGSAGFDKALEQGAVSGIMKGGEQGLGAYQTSQYNAGVKKADQEAQAAGAANAGLGQNMANDLYSNQMKAPMLAKGGQVHMDSGSFVIPADIVSALGDGSTEAGFRFLESFFKDAEAE